MRFDSIHNYYEGLVFQEIEKQVQDNNLEQNEDYISDIACVALNQLPSRYVRHNVDMIFYMSPDEREQNELNVKEAVKMAVKYVDQHRHDERPETINQ